MWLIMLLEVEKIIFSYYFFLLNIFSIIRKIFVVNMYILASGC